MNKKNIGNKLLISYFMVLFMAIILAVIINTKMKNNRNDVNLEDMIDLGYTNLKHIDVSGAIHVKFVNDDNEKVGLNPALENDKNILVKYNNSTLNISYNKFKNDNTNEPALFISSKNIRTITLRNKALVYFDHIITDSLTLFADSSEFKFNTLTINYLTINLTHNAHFSGDSVKCLQNQIYLNNSSNIWSGYFESDVMEGKINEFSKLIYRGDIKSIHLQLDKTARINKY